MRGRALQADILGQLWTLLRDQYPLSGRAPYRAMTVLKELLQNTDDAPGSRVVHFGWMPPISNASHPLLRGCPIFFYVNDGEFSGENAFAITKLGISESAGRVERIGHFGMGLKSIFHLGEVFFWMSSRVESPEFRGERFENQDLVTPWLLSGHHDDWNDFAEGDLQALRGRIRSVVSGLERFLAFVAPLRRPDDVPSPNLTSEGFRGSDIVDSRIALAIARILPNLRRVETVYAFELDEAGQGKRIVTIDLRPASNPGRMMGPENLGSDNRGAQWFGVAEWETDREPKTRVRYVGRVQSRARETHFASSRTYGIAARIRPSNCSRRHI